MSALAAMWMLLKTGAGRWLAGLGAVVLAIGAALAYGWRKGAKGQKAADLASAAQAAVDAANATAQAVTQRQEIEHEIAKLPDAPAQDVATADPATAAGKLRDDGWLRGSDRDASR